MAGFQKFPVPRSAHIDFWNYNKKWMGNSIALLAGSFLTWMSINRYIHNQIKTNTGVGNYIDPTHELAPKPIKI